MIRTRFAPSPTGFLHVGGLRTALYAWLFARKNHGAFILRIEDTDQSRFVKGALENLLQTLHQVGLEYDEGPKKDGKYGPYIQSERTEIYRRHAGELLDKKAAYLCFCTPQRLEEMRQRQTAAHKAPMYDRTCLNLGPEEIEAKKKSGTPYVIRQKIRSGHSLKFGDLIRGNVSFETSTIDDQVLMKSDHFPTYHLANVVDDHLMEITHVIRGEEWLPSTPKHLLLYEAFGWQAPQFAHIPLLLNKDKTKLSKRQGDVSVESYLEKGYIKEALINFIALLGWHPGKGLEKEIFSIDELIESFSLEQVHKAGAIFDIEKLDWFNFVWKRKIYEEHLGKNPTSGDRGKLLLQECEKYLPKDWLKKKELLLKALITIEEKILRKAAEAPQHLNFYFEPKKLDENLLCNPKMKVDRETAKKALQKSLEALQKLSVNDLENLENLKKCLGDVVAELAFKNSQVFWPVRVALTREQYSPGVFEVIWALGKQETLRRLEEVLKKIA